MLKPKSRLQRALEYIKGYCEKHSTCDSCAFDRRDGCPFCEVPADWDVEEMIRKKKEKEEDE